MNLKTTVKQINDTEAVLKFEDGDVISWPLNKLPKEIKDGDLLTFSISDNGGEADPEKLAKDLLNEILNIE